MISSKLTLRITLIAFLIYSWFFAYQIGKGNGRQEELAHFRGMLFRPAQIAEAKR